MTTKNDCKRKTDTVYQDLFETDFKKFRLPDKWTNFAERQRRLFTLINLQNFSWNSKDSVDFCFNIGVALKATMKNTDKKKPTVHHLTVYLRESSYLPDKRQEYKFRNKTGYMLTGQSDLNDFVTELKTDFENQILPTLDN